MANGRANQRSLLGVVIAATVATPLLILGAIHTMDGIHTSALQWLEETNPVRQEYDTFTRQFEGGNFILVSWQGCTTTDPRLGRVEALLAKDAQQEGSLLDRVTSGKSLLRELQSRELPLSQEQLVDRLRGSMVGPDGKSTCLAVVLSETGALHRADSLAFVERAAVEATGIEASHLRFAGPAIDALAIDVESDKSVDYYSGPSALVSFLICWWFLRSVRLTVAILAVAGFGELTVLGSLYYLGVTMDAVLIVLPPLVFVLTVSAGIHLVNYYFDQVRSGAEADAPRQAMRSGWLPCSLAALTTAIGLGSLVVSRIVPISTFGQFAAAGVVMTVLLLFLVLPGVMSRWPTRREDLDASSRTDPSTVVLARLSGLVCRFATVITIAGIVLLIYCGFGLTRLRTSIGITNLFPAESRVVQDFTWIENNVAHLVPLEVVLRFTSDDPSRMVERLWAVQQIEQAVLQVPDVHGVMSVATFSPKVPSGRRSGAVSKRGNINAALEENKQELIDSHFLAETHDGQAWRISARVSGVDDLDYDAVLSDLRRRVEPLLDSIGERLEHRPTATYTGVMPLVFRAQHALLEDMFFSMVLAFVLIWIVMSIVLTDPGGKRFPGPLSILKGLWLGALAMLPNLFPVVVIFGVMGWLDWPADIGSTMTACVALGIAVDDTLHFLAWYRRESAGGAGRTVAIRHCFQHCGRAMIQTTVICGLGMMVFCLSGFMPTRRFAILMFTLLNMALLADLVFLPAILASPLGSVFAVRKQADAEPETAS